MPSRGVTTLCALVGVVSLVFWIALTMRAESPLGRVGAALFLATGGVLLLAAWSMVLRGRRPRRLMGLAIPAVLGLWALAMAATSAAQGEWGWAVLLALPTAFLLALFVLAVVRGDRLPQGRNG